MKNINLLAIIGVLCDLKNNPLPRQGVARMARSCSGRHFEKTVCRRRAKNRVARTSQQRNRTV